MKALSIIAAVAALFPSAIAASAPTISPGSTFSLTAVSDNPAINGKTVNAVDSFFYLNVNTNGVCHGVCPFYPFTIYTTGLDGVLELSIEAPLHQQVYALYGDDNHGKLAFNYGDSSDLDGATYGGVTYVNGYALYHGGDFLACPSVAGYSNYSVHAGDGGISGCLSFKAQYSLERGPVVWEYY